MTLVQTLDQIQFKNIYKVDQNPQVSTGFN